MVVATSLIGYNQSASGKNTYIVGCDAINRRQHYCICVNFLRAIEDERLGEEQFMDCQQALKNGHCSARSMRDEEKKAGVPIYFTPRAEKVPSPVNKPEAKKSYRAPGTTKPAKSKKKEDDGLIGSNMAEVISAAVKGETEKPLLILPRKGESLLQFAVRYRGANV